MAAQTWDVTLYTYVPAAGYGNTVSSGYGSATAAQSWDVLLLDGSAVGYGNTVSSGYDDGSVEGAGEVVWHDIEVDVAAWAYGLGNTVSSGYGEASNAQRQEFIVHLQGIVPGATIGAYRRWEWKGPVAAKLNAGPGAAVDTTTVADDLTATFALPVGEYVAYAPAYPTRRLFFMVTPD